VGWLSNARLFLNIIIDAQPGWVSRTDKALKGKGFKTRLTPPSTISALKAYGTGNPGEIVREVEELLANPSWRALCIEHWLLVEKECPCRGGRACVEVRNSQLLHAHCREDGGVSYRVLNTKTPPSNPLSIPRSVFKICTEPSGVQDLKVKLLKILEALTSIE
jgi:hypothetical protein